MKAYRRKDGSWVFYKHYVISIEGKYPIVYDLQRKQYMVVSDSYNYWSSYSTNKDLLKLKSRAKKVKWRSVTCDNYSIQFFESGFIITYNGVAVPFGRKVEAVVRL